MGCNYAHRLFLLKSKLKTLGPGYPKRSSPRLKARCRFKTDGMTIFMCGNQSISYGKYSI